MNLSVIKNLTPETNEPHVLRNVARWHLGDYRNGRRNRVIADALYAAAATDGGDVREAA